MIDAQTKSFRHFMIVDDDPIIASLLEQLLIQRGAKRVYVANDGEQALEILSDPSKTVDVMSLDLNMPNMDGVTFLSKAAEMKFQGGIYLVSGETKEIVNSARQLCRLIGIDCRGAFPKPIDFDNVVDELISAKVSPLVARDFAPLQYEEVAAGLSENRLKAYYQPKIGTFNRNICGAEALARIVRADGSALHVGEMIRIAEERGLIRELTWQIAQRVVGDYSSIKEQIPNEFVISFNVSSDLLTDTVFCEQLTDYVKENGLEPSNFVLELTESKIPADVSVALEGLTRLRLLGFGLAIDDFGTGYSNMETLRIFPFTELKVDQQFILNARNDNFAWACVEASVKLAKQLNLSIVAEGVETEFEATLAKTHAIDELQGYMFSRPLPPASFIEYAKAFYRERQQPTPQARRSAG